MERLVKSLTESHPVINWFAQAPAIRLGKDILHVLEKYKQDKKNKLLVLNTTNQVAFFLRQQATKEAREYATILNGHLDRLKTEG